MTADLLTLRVELPAGEDDEALAELVAGLGAELLELDVDEVAPASVGDAPDGAKGLELAAAGALVVKLARTGKLLGQVVAAIRDWAGRNGDRTVKVALGGDTLEITGASAGEVKTVVDAWVRRHGEP